MHPAITYNDATTDESATSSGERLHLQSACEVYQACPSVIRPVMQAARS